MESSKQQKQNEEAERLARQNERNNKIQGVKNRRLQKQHDRFKKRSRIVFKKAEMTQK